MCAPGISYLPKLSGSLSLPENEEKPSLIELGRKIEQAKLNSRSKDCETKARSAMHVSVDLLAGVLAGSFVGFFLDKWLDTLPLFFITCFFLGIAGAVRNILRTIRNIEKK